MEAIHLIALERAEQLSKHGFTLAKDAARPEGELVGKAIAILTEEADEWPAEPKYWERIRGKSRAEQLVIAAAIIAAAADVLLSKEDAVLDQESAWPYRTRVRISEDVYGHCIRAGVDAGVAEHMGTQANKVGEVRAAWRAEGALWLRIEFTNGATIEVPRTACTKL